jgi:hypothetical protein
MVTLAVFYNCPNNGRLWDRAGPAPHEIYSKNQPL